MILRAEEEQAYTYQGGSWVSERPSCATTADLQKKESLLRGSLTINTIGVNLLLSTLKDVTESPSEDSGANLPLPHRAPSRV